MALAEQQARRTREEKYANYVAMAKWLTVWRSDSETAYLAAVPIHFLQNTLKALDEAYQDFFKKSGGFPKFKRYGQSVGLRETDAACFKLDQGNGRIRMPKVGFLRYRKSRDIDGIPKIATLTHEADGWYVSVMAETTSNALPSSTRIGGGDRGVNNFLATDTGRLVEPLDAHEKSLYRLRRYQRVVARRIEAAKVAAGIPKDQPFPKGFRLNPSNRLKKAQARVANIHQKISRQRSDFLHKLSTEIADGHAVFCLEDLKTKNMTASARGDAEVPGKNVKQKSGLNRSILDQGWATWATQLTYKLEWRGGRVIKVPAAYTSQKCAECGHIHPDNRHGEKFKCLACGHEDHADVNAAKNILAAGYAVLAGETPGDAFVEDAVQSGRPVKRKPTEGPRHAI
jgi:putative transposase